MKKICILVVMISVAGGCSTASKNAPSPSLSQAAAPVVDSVGPGKSITKKAAHTPSFASSMACSHDSDERKLEIKKKSPGCDLMYTKLGDTRAVASSEKSQAHCKEVMERIVKKLEASGFICQ